MFHFPSIVSFFSPTNISTFVYYLWFSAFLYNNPWQISISALTSVKSIVMCTSSEVFAIQKMYNLFWPTMFHSISRLNADTNPTICTTKGSYSRSAMLASLPNKTQHTKASVFSNCAINNHIRFILLVNAVSRDHSLVDLVREFKGP